MGGTAHDPVPDVSPLTGHDPRTLGPYRLLGRLGKGGQGVVYLGADGSERRVAVKTINVDLQHNPKAKAQFAKEIAAARRVTPFCTAQILYAEIDTELPYVVSEYIAGPTLHKQVRDHGPLADNALYRLAVGTATALAAIHQAGIVHCDFKPDNVILGGDGPRVIDFGIARALGAETMSGHVMGTVPYMAPERFHNVDVGPACDIFGWAATIGFASSGRGPFGHDSMATVMARVLSEPPDLDNLSGTLRELVVDCLAKDQQARPTAQQLLMRLLGHEATPAAPVPLVEALQEGSDAATALLQPGHDSATATATAPTATAPQPTVTATAAQPAAPTVTAPRLPTDPNAAPPQAPTVPQPSATRTAPQPTAITPQSAGGHDQHSPAPGGRQSASVGRASRSRRLLRQVGDPVGIATALVLGAGGFAAGYVPSAQTSTGAVVGGGVLVVVYLVRLFTAVALDDGAPGPAER
ncbi:serine/threonine-protein kinase [Catellatospora sichuanensis]|uniref:serine/threonine-protein kinase n=1 Tax=Catellatospora sichuanensis TaxID=1969805 RepID=UPI001181EACE|nr:serine/threonine-protein kinase [Catellatospora sichuanensis]